MKFSSKKEYEKWLHFMDNSIRIIEVSTLHVDKKKEDNYSVCYEEVTEEAKYLMEKYVTQKISARKEYGFHHFFILIALIVAFLVIQRENVNAILSSPTELKFFITNVIVISLLLIIPGVVFYIYKKRKK